MSLAIDISVAYISVSNQTGGDEMAVLAPERATSRGLDDLPIPPFAVETPCFVILEDAVLHNLERTAQGAGGMWRLMPHIKTHRAQWLVELMLARGVTAFKAATPAEVEIALAARAPYVVWAYPTVSRPSIARVIQAAARHAGARVTGLVDSKNSLDAWMAELRVTPGANVRLRVDLDSGLGRTGIAISPEGIALGLAVKKAGLFDGWHCYDGHIQDRDLERRLNRIDELAARLREFLTGAREAELDGA
jgi:D-serine deaminase-like pyridoxal phosphate-dependent protein